MADSPNAIAQVDQIRALGQEHLDERVEVWRKQIAAGLDPSRIFADLWNGSLMAGPESTVGMLCSAIERLGQEPAR